MTNINTYKIPFEAYSNEMDYIAPAKVEHATAEQAKRKNIKIGRTALFSFKDKLSA